MSVLLLFRVLLAVIPPPVLYILVYSAETLTLSIAQPQNLRHWPPIP